MFPCVGRPSQGTVSTALKMAARSVASAAGKDRRKIVTAVGRELLGFIWAIGVKAETQANQQIAA